MKEPRNSFRENKPRYSDRPSFNKPFKKSFDKSGKTFDKGKRFEERKIVTFKACIVRLERFSREDASSIALEKTLQEIMEHFSLAVFGYASQKEISVIFDLSQNEVYGNNADKLITVAASVAGVTFTKVAGDGKDHYFSGALFQPFKDKVIDYFEERQAKFGGGLIAYRNEEGVEIEDAKNFNDDTAYLLEKLKNVAEERKDEFKAKSFNDDRPKRKSFGEGKPSDIVKARNFKGVDTTKSPGYLERQAKKNKGKA